MFKAYYCVVLMTMLIEFVDGLKPPKLGNASTEFMGLLHCHLRFEDEHLVKFKANGKQQLDRWLAAIWGASGMDIQKKSKNINP